jgi:parvulin-like peptidyl-prolyl isomerase
MKRAPLRAIATVALGLVLTSCGGLLDTSAAKVNGEEISAEAIEAELDSFRKTERYKQLAGQGDIEAVERQYIQGVLATLVRRAVLAPVAREEGLEVTPDDIEAELDLIRADFPDENAFQEALKEQALTLPQLREFIGDRLVEDRLREVVTTDVGASEEEIMDFYESNITDYQQSCAQHILVADQGEARLIAAQLQRASAAEIDELFEQLAAERSQDSSNAKSGGDLGCNPAGQFVAPFEEAMAELEVGEISDPVQTEFGWHIIRVNARETASLDEVRDQIADQLSTPLQDEAWQDYLEGLYEEAGVKIDPSYGVLDIATGQITDPDATTVPGGQAPRATQPSEAPMPSPAQP